MQVMHLYKYLPIHRIFTKVTKKLIAPINEDVEIHVADDGFWQVCQHKQKQKLSGCDG
jgi:hypothetical protein